MAIICKQYISMLDEGYVLYQSDTISKDILFQLVFLFWNWFLMVQKQLIVFN